MSIVAVAASLKAAVQPALDALPIADVVAMSPDEVAALVTLPNDYLELRVEPMYGETRRASSTSERRGWRAVLRAVSLFEGNCAAIYDAFDGALRDQFVTVDGRPVLVKFETATESTDDNGRVVAVAFYNAIT